MEPSKVRIFYLRNKQKFPVACVASTVENNMLKYAVSTHNPLDIYDKKAARKMATVRLASAKLPLTFGGTVECSDAKDAKKMLLEAVAANVKLSQRARDAAKHWLKSVTQEQKIA